jgi:hypothetical protein
MQELKPYTTLAPIKKALDNGGRFYNFFDKQDDEVVSRGELAKAAGVFTAGIQAFMFLEMSKQDLGAKDQDAAVALLDGSLRKKFTKSRPPMTLPSRVEKDHKAGQSIIITGFARQIEDKTQFKGFIIVPIMVGKVFVPMMIPLFDRYRIFEVFDDEKMKKPSGIVATELKKKLVPQGRIQFGGLLKKLSYQKKEPQEHLMFLEAIFYAKR